MEKKNINREKFLHISLQLLKINANESYDEVVPYDQIKFLIKELYKLLVVEMQKVDAPGDFSIENWKKGTDTDHGLAVSPFVAAQCTKVKEFNRTTKFLLGLRDAVLQKKKEKKQNERIIIFDAGCGPFATLVLPLVSVFTPKELGFVLLDIHEISVTTARSIIQNLGFEDYLVDSIVGDAVKYKIPNLLESIDIIVTETMQSGLSVEPQVAISRNLVLQAPSDVILVPEIIRLNLVKEYNNQDPKKKKFEFVQTVFEVSKKTITEMYRELDRTSRLRGFPLKNHFEWDTKRGGHARKEKAEEEEGEEGEEEKTFEYKIMTEVITFGKHIIEYGEEFRESEMTEIKELNCCEFKSQERIVTVRGFEYKLGFDPCLVATDELNTHE